MPHELWAVGHQNTRTWHNCYEGDQCFVLLITSGLDSSLHESPVAAREEEEDEHGHAQNRKKLGTGAWMPKEECWTVRKCHDDKEAQDPVLVICQAVVNHSFPSLIC